MSKLEAMVVGSAARLGVDEIALLVVGIVVVAAASVGLVLKLAY